ncbi:MAG: DNA primase [Chloroflexi bacterium]|nr:DNA primase [Chloroflexota bacterium]
MSITDDIKERLDIVEVVSGYVPALRPSGRNFIAPCPFHSERTPSFVVFPDRRSWRCFGGCATGGDVLSFVMRAEKLDFKEALRLLAQRAGVSLAERRDSPQRSVLYRVNEAAAAFFQELLRSQQGIAARAYLQGRGLDADAIRRFQLGLSPGTGSGLQEHLVALGFSPEQIVEAGLATQPRDTPSRDMFVGRIMFPIHDAGGELAGFGGRSLDGSEPKYLNSPRTPVFDKGNILYLFHRAKKAIREQGEGVIVEGYMDAIAAHQHGFEDVVASMGTSLTGQQVALLKGAAKRFVMAMDADAAGQSATFRSLRDSWHALGGRTDVSLRVLLLPFGKDPDELIRSSPEAWRAAVTDARPILDYLLSMVPQLWDLSSGQGKQLAWEELRPLVYEQGNVFDQDTYLRKVADILGTSIERLQAEGGLPRPRRNAASPQKAAGAVKGEAFETRDSVEELFLAMLLRWPELKARGRDLVPECIDRWEDRQIFTAWLASNTIEGLAEMLDDDLRQRFELLFSLSIPPMDLRQREQAVRDCFYRLEERRLRSLKREEALLLAQPAEEGGHRTLEELSQQAIDTNTRLRELFHERVGRQRRGAER